MNTEYFIDNGKAVELVEKALEARALSYARYSHFRVGAALLTQDGEIIQGCNIENASYGATMCAERTAIFSAVARGKRSFRAIAIAGGTEGSDPDTYAYPCGLCLQVMSEFCDPEFNILIAKSKEDFKWLKLKDLMPTPFELEV